MTARIYPSQQDTNLTAKGSLILTKYSLINNIQIKVNNRIVAIEYNIVEGLYKVNLNVGDFVEVISNTITYFNINRKDYTTDDTNNNGIITTSIYNSNSTTDYSFIAATVDAGYNFEYLVEIGVPSPTPTPTPTVSPTPTATPTPTPVPVPGYFDAAFSTSGFTGSSVCFDAPIYNFSGSSINLATCDYVSATIISTAPVDGVFTLSVGTAFREYRRQGSSNIGYKTSNFTLLCPTRTPTPTPTPTVTPTPTPGPYTNGYTILVNGTSPSYPGTGTTWTSLATGTTYNGTLTNGPVWSGGTPSYFTFDGTNDYVDFGASSTGATTGSTSFGVWFKTTTSATQKVIAMRGNDSSGNGWSLLIGKQNNDKMEVGIVSSFPTSLELESTTTLVSNTWYYVYGVWNRGTNLKIYVNGVLENTGTFTVTTLRTSGIGWGLARGNAGQYSDTSIGEFVVYNRVLTDTEILNNFNNTKSQYGY